jgi:hypothetical protein
MAESGQQELTLEQDFTRHIFSLFGSLYDSRASPYIGPIPPPDGEEPAPDDDAMPPLDASLCDFRLRLSYTNEVDSRPAVLDELAAKGEAIVISAADPKSISTIVLGDKLPARTVSGRSADADFQARRKEALLRSRKVAEIRRKTAVEERKLDSAKVSETHRQERAAILRRLQEIRQAEKDQRDDSPTLIHEWALERKRLMIERRKHLDERRAIEWQQVEEARKSIQNVSYRSQYASAKSPEKEDRGKGGKSWVARKEAGKAVRKYNEENSKAAKPLRTSSKV